MVNCYKDKEKQINCNVELISSGGKIGYLYVRSFGEIKQAFILHVSVSFICKVAILDLKLGSFETFNFPTLKSNFIETALYWNQSLNSWYSIVK